jgi:trimeric autotransporter adhesin
MACLQALGALRRHGSNNTTTAAAAASTTTLSTTASLTSSLTSPLRGTKKVPRVIHAVQFLVRYDPQLRHSTAAKHSSNVAVVAVTQQCNGLQEGVAWQYDMQHNTLLIAAHNPNNINGTSTVSTTTTAAAGSGKTATTAGITTASTTPAAGSVAAAKSEQALQVRDVMAVELVTCLTPASQPLFDHLLAYQAKQRAKQQAAADAAAATAKAAAAAATEAATLAAAARTAALGSTADRQVPSATARGTATTAGAGAATPAMSAVANKSATAAAAAQKQREPAITVAEIEAADVALAAVAAAYGTTVEDAVQTLDPELDLENGELLLDVLAAAIHTVALTSKNTSTVQLAHIRQQLHDAVRPSTTAKAATTAATAASSAAVPSVIAAAAAQEAQHCRLQQEHAASVIGRAARAKQSRDAAATKRTTAPAAASAPVAAPAVVTTAAKAATPLSTAATTAAAVDAEQYTRQQDSAAGVIGRAVRAKQARAVVAIQREVVASAAPAVAAPAAVVSTAMPATATIPQVSASATTATTKTAVTQAAAAAAVVPTAAPASAAAEKYTRQQEHAAGVIGRAARGKQARGAVAAKRDTTAAAPVIAAVAATTVTEVKPTSSAASTTAPAAATTAAATSPAAAVVLAVENSRQQEEQAAGVICRAARAKLDRDVIAVKRQERADAAPTAAAVPSVSAAAAPVTAPVVAVAPAVVTVVQAAPASTAIDFKSSAASTKTAVAPAAAAVVPAIEHSRQQEEQAAGVIYRAARAKLARDVVGVEPQERAGVATTAAAPFVAAEAPVAAATAAATATATAAAAPAAAPAAAAAAVAARRPSSYLDAARGKPSTAAVPATAATTAGVSPVLQAVPRTAVCEAVVHTTATSSSANNSTNSSSNNSSTSIHCTVQWRTPPAQSGTLYTIAGSAVLQLPPADLDDDAAQARLERTLQTSYGLSVEQAVAVLGDLPGVDLASADSVIAGLGTAVHTLRPACGAAAASAAVERALRGPGEWETLELYVTGSLASTAAVSTTARSVRVTGVRDAPATAAVVAVDCSAVTISELAAVLRSGGVPDSAAKVVLALSHLIDIAAVLQTAASTTASGETDAAKAFMLPTGASTVTTASSAQYRVTTAVGTVTVAALTAAGDDVLTVKVTLPLSGASHALNKSTANTDSSASLANNASVVSLHAGGVSGVILPLTSSSSSTGDSGDALTVGTAVEARFDGRAKWFGGTVVAVNAADSSYTVHYDDGDSEEHVLRLRIRLPGQKQPRALAIGSLIDARRGKVSFCVQLA